MAFQSSASTYLAVCCCVCALLALTPEARVQDRCDAELKIPADYDQTGSGEVGGNGDVHRRSLSPWTWRAKTEEDRIPATIWEAECTTSDCSYSTTTPLDGSYNSVPIYQQVLVLRQTRNRKCYRVSFLSVAVGCTCVLPQI